MNASVRDDNRLIGLRWRAGAVNDGDVLKNQSVRRNGFGYRGKKQKKKDQFRRKLQATRPIWATEDHWPHTITFNSLAAWHRDVAARAEKSCR